MKRWLLSLICIVILGGASRASAVLISDVVGGLDPLVAVGTRGNASDELAFINDILGLSWTLGDVDAQKTDVTATDWEAVIPPSQDLPDDYALDLTLLGPADYYLLKTGANNTGFDMFLFKNISNLDYGYIALGYNYSAPALTLPNLEPAIYNWDDDSTLSSFYLDFGNSGNGEQSIGKVSHITRVGDPIPEPATMLLFGVGMAGLVGARLRRKR